MLMNILPVDVAAHLLNISVSGHSESCNTLSLTLSLLKHLHQDGELMRIGVIN